MHDIEPTPTGPTAQDELDRLLQNLHQQGVLRFANDLVASSNPILKELIDGLNSPGTLNALQNLSILLMALSRSSPAQFYKFVFAFKSAVAHLGHQPGDDVDSAPGVRGAYRLLNDDELWHSLTPLLEAIRIFSQQLDKKVDNPISAFSGKQGSP